MINDAYEVASFAFFFFVLELRTASEEFAVRLESGQPFANAILRLLQRCLCFSQIR